MFGFHIVNFPFMSSNIPSAPAYGVYASQLTLQKFSPVGDGGSGRRPLPPDHLTFW